MRIFVISDIHGTKDLALSQSYMIRCHSDCVTIQKYEKIDKNFPFKTIIKLNKYFKYSFLAKIMYLFPIFKSNT